MSFFFSSPFDSPFYTAAPRAQPRRYHQQPSYYVPRGYYPADHDSSDDEEDYQSHHRQATPQQRYNYQQLQQLRQQQLKEEYERQQLQQQRQEQLRLQRMRQLEQQRQEELRRRHEYERRQQELLKQQQEKRIREQEQLQFRRKVLFLRFTHAAKVIQRAFRTYLANKRDHAAKVIQTAFKRSQEREALKGIMEKLGTVRTLGDQLAKLREQHEATVLSKPVYPDPNATLPNKDYLMYEDALLKLMITLDGVSSAGSELVRDARKALVAQAQKQLQVIDQHKNNSKTAVPEEISPKDEAVSEAPEDTKIHEIPVASETSDAFETSDAESEPVLVEMEEESTAEPQEDNSTESSMEVDQHDPQDQPESPSEESAEFTEPRIEEADENDSEENKEADSDEGEETEIEEPRTEVEEDAEAEEPAANDEVSTDSNWVLLPEQTA